MKALLFLLLGLLSAGAQTALDRSLVVAGTTSGSGTDIVAWLAWQPSSPAVLEGRTLAIYRKTGNAASTNSFTRQGVAEPVTDVRTIDSLVPRAVQAGQNLTDLDNLLAEMLAGTSAAGTPRSAQLSAMVIQAQSDPVQYERAVLTGRQHPLVALCMGLAFADRIPASGNFTFEVRDFNPATSADLGVVGRVTVNHGSLLTLPAPGPPRVVPDTSPKGDRNASLRWATPNALRDLAPMHHGFDLYRVPRAAAEARGWQTTPPATTAALRAEPSARQVNLLAILPPATLTAAEAVSSPASLVFFTDDNNRHHTGGTAFADGSEYYYFVTARDLLGRGGAPSAGTLAVMSDRLPPLPPVNLRVTNRTGYTVVDNKRRQHLQVTWEAPALEPGESIAGWLVYRWRTPGEIAGRSIALDPVTGQPENNLIASLPASQFTLVDDGGTAPPAWAVPGELPPSLADGNDVGQVYYYTVRTIKAGSAGVFSGNSAPAWGVLRDRYGPAGASGSLLLNCLRPTLMFTGYTQLVSDGLTADQGHYVFTCTSPSPKGFEWAEFELLRSGPVWEPLGRANFIPTANTSFAALRKTLPQATGDVIFRCRVGTRAGVISAWSQAQEGSPPAQPNRYILAAWNATLKDFLVPGDQCGWTHQTIDPFTGNTFDLCGTFTPTTGSKEYKVYRRIDHSPLTLIDQGFITSPAEITWKDTAPVASNVTACYFLQLFDEHGNPSPLEQQGQCVASGDASLLPTPMLEPLRSRGNAANPRLRVSWFCQTAGVERFEIWVARSTGRSVDATGSGLSADLSAVHPNTLTNVDGTNGLDFFVFQTGAARHLNPDGTPEFTADLPVVLNENYTVLVRAVGPGTYAGGRLAGTFSNAEGAAWTTRDLAPTAVVPWPERALAPKADFHPGVRAVYLNTSELGDWRGCGVRIGEYSDPFHDAQTTSGVGQGIYENDRSPRIYRITGLRDAEQYLYTNDETALAEPKESIPGLILPVVLYRVQVPSTRFPVVPGDIVQVSPMIEQIAQFRQSPNIVVTDPFVAFLHRDSTNLPATSAQFDHDILLLDRQPVLVGARYKYLLVRFGPGREIERVMVTNEVDVFRPIPLPPPPPPPPPGP